MKEFLSGGDGGERLDGWEGLSEKMLEALGMNGFVLMKVSMSSYGS